MQAPESFDVSAMTALPLCCAVLATLSVLNRDRFCMDGSLLAAAWWQCAVWLIGRVVATWLPGCCLKTGNICAGPVDFCRPQLTPVLPYPCAIMWTRRFRRHCLNSKRVLMAYHRGREKKLAVRALSRWMQQGKFLRGLYLCLEVASCSLSAHAVLVLITFI
jgi:hypothetical protein